MDRIKDAMWTGVTFWTIIGTAWLFFTIYSRIPHEWWMWWLPF